MAFGTGSTVQQGCMCGVVLVRHHSRHETARAADRSLQYARSTVGETASPSKTVFFGHCVYQQVPEEVLLAWCVLHVDG